MTQYICILDFEATCWKNTNNHEIIEFPSVLLKWTDEKIQEVARIQMYVKPKLNPVVSVFCEELTGITQKIVNSGIDLKTAITKHSQWLKGFSEHENITIVTCGSWDLQVMLPADLKVINLKPEAIYTRYVNLKDLFKTVTGTKTKPLPMTGMLNHYGLKLLGRHHSGLDDCRNLAQIFIQLVEGGLTKQMFMDHLTQDQDLIQD